MTMQAPRRRRPPAQSEASAAGDALADGRPFLDDFLLYLLARAAAASTTGVASEVRRHGFAIPEWRVLLTLADGALTVGELAELMLMKQPTLTKILDRLEAAGMVARRPDPQDGRRVRIFLTEDGLAYNREMIPRALDHESRLLAGFTAAEAAALKSALKKLIAQIG